MITTDLSAAYDTCDSFLLLNMLEHIDFCNLELEVMTTYLTKRKAFVEVQGFFSKILEMPDCSVVQGSKLSTTLYTIYTLDTTKIKEVMKDNERYKEIVKKELTPTNNPDHTSIGYIDDVTHVMGLEDKEEQECYLNDLYSLLEKHYNNKILQINGAKTQFLTIQ